MEEIHFGENLDFGIMALARDVALNVRLLYDLYFDYVASHQLGTCPYKIPDRFVLVSGFACVFPDLEVTSGYVPFIASTEDHHPLRVSLIPHHWLTWREVFIFDLLPVDSKFGISTPQVVLENRSRKRFLQAGSIYPKDWGREEKVAFDNNVNALAEILETLMKKVPT